MEKQEFNGLVPTPNELVKKIQATKKFNDIELYQKQYDQECHDIMDPHKRPDKLIETSNGPSAISVGRLPISLQKKIVMLAAAILCGNPIRLSSAPENPIEKDMLEVLKRSWKDNKLDYESKRIAKLMMSETEVAEIWYTEPIKEGFWKGTPNDVPEVAFRQRMKIIANSYGDTLYPIFNNSGDMIAFGRGYQITVNDKPEEHFDIYTDTLVYEFIKSSGNWVGESRTNKAGKIPVIYYNQVKPEWHNVQHLIDRFEVSVSNHGDTNDYFGSPSYFVEGEVTGWAKKGEQGKVIEGKNGSKVTVLSWDQSPESVKLEQGNLRSLIFDMTDTPDITKDNENLSGVQSGIALKMRFLPAHLKAADKEETFGKSIQRRINFMKAALAKINLTLEPAVPMLIEPKFEYYVPKNDTETIDLLSTATGAKPILSTTTAVELNPLVQDPEQEMKRLQEDENASLT